LQHPDITIYLQIDKKSRISAGDLLPEARIIMNNTSVYWSIYSKVQATLNSHRVILDREQNFEYLAFISGQDYPIMTAVEILLSVADYRGKELIGHVILDQNGWYKARAENNYFRYIEWLKVKGNKSPNVLTVKDFPSIIASGMHFARKFDIQTDEKILDMIDECLESRKG
jgi:hypothetical protein